MRRRNELIKGEALLSDTIEIRVRFNEVDSMQVVWHGSYIQYFEDGRESFGRRYKGLAYQDIAQSGFFTPMVEMQQKYLAPLKLDDVAILRTSYHYTDAAKICFSYELRHKESNQLIAKAQSVQAFTDREGNLILNKPPFYLKWQKEWLKK